jgi:hypothetical protein
MPPRDWKPKYLLYIHTWIHSIKYMRTYIRKEVCSYIITYVCLCRYIRIYYVSVIFIGIYARVYLCLYVCACLFTYVCAWECIIYIHIHESMYSHMNFIHTNVPFPTHTPHYVTSQLSPNANFSGFRVLKINSKFCSITFINSNSRTIKIFIYKWKNLHEKTSSYIQSDIFIIAPFCEHCV